MRESADRKSLTQTKGRFRKDDKTFLLTLESTHCCLTGVVSCYSYTSSLFLLERDSFSYTVF